MRKAVTTLAGIAALALSAARANAAQAPNLLTNPSFKGGATIATSWSDEHTTASPATYSLVTSHGAAAQRIVYHGRTGDKATAKLELYQAPISVSPGEALTFSVDISGRLTKTAAAIGVEAFTAKYAYISESDLYVQSIVTSTPQRFSVNYTCPANASYVAVYFQGQEIRSSSVISVQLGSASLTGGAPTLSTWVRAATPQAVRTLTRLANVHHTIGFRSHSEKLSYVRVTNAGTTPSIDKWAAAYITARNGAIIFEHKRGQWMIAAAGSSDFDRVPLAVIRKLF